jgi:hypothetical protein
VTAVPVREPGRCRLCGALTFGLLCPTCRPFPVLTSMCGDAAHVREGRRRAVVPARLVDVQEPPRARGAVHATARPHARTHEERTP